MHIQTISKTKYEEVGHEYFTQADMTIHALVEKYNWPVDVIYNSRLYKFIKTTCIMAGEDFHSSIYAGMHIRADLNEYWAFDYAFQEYHFGEYMVPFSLIEMTKREISISVQGGVFILKTHIYEPWFSYNNGELAILPSQSQAFFGQSEREFMDIYLKLIGVVQH